MFENASSFPSSKEVGKKAYVTMMKGKLKEIYKTNFPMMIFKDSQEKEINFKGILRKRGRDFFKTTKKRFFTLQNNFLVYYKSEKDYELRRKSPVGAFSMKLLINVRMKKEEITLVFASGFCVLLVASDVGNAAQWKYHILKHKHFYKLRKDRRIQRMAKLRNILKGAAKSSVALKEILKRVREKKSFVNYLLEDDSKIAVMRH